MATAISANKAELLAIANSVASEKMIDKAIARHGFPVVDGSEEVGVVTSGTHSPTLKKASGLAYLPLAKSVQGNEFTIRVRGKEARARVVPTPFYKRAK